jgi:hypothetical protein
MGHTEMVLAVAGLSSQAVNERVKRLAGGDWSSYKPNERIALQFAYKQAKDPSSIESRDLQALIGQCGPERALDFIWWSCRCHYMTCISDAFQLPLEEMNVFDGFAPVGAKP